VLWVEEQMELIARLIFSLPWAKGGGATELTEPATVSQGVNEECVM